VKIFTINFIIRKYGIKEIPLSDVKEWGTKRGLSQETIEEILKGGKPVYTAPILPGEVTLRRAWSSKYVDKIILTFFPDFLYTILARR